MPKCLNECCGFEHEDPYKFPPTISVYHDFRCPECGTTNIDTSDIYEKEPLYGYGEHNTINLGKNNV
jgi:hypothetical protein|tara:strand:+ start:994 stop:1194 length:201 start_codon:yes stop_codon:yes gene_type:complete